MLRQIAQPLAGTDADSWKTQVRRQYFRDDTGFEHYVKCLENSDSDYFYMLSTQVLGSATATCFL